MKNVLGDIDLFVQKDKLKKGEENGQMAVGDNEDLMRPNGRTV